MTYFWEAISEVSNNELDLVVPEYRVYYDILGNIQYYSMESSHIDDDCEYVIITAEEYKLSRYDLVVNNGKMVEIKEGIMQKLIPVITDGVTCAIDDIAIITQIGQQWGLKRYV